MHARGVPVRAFVRDRGKAAAVLGNACDVAIGDVTDPASVAAAMVGVDRVFLNSADGPAKVEHETGAVDAAAAAGVTGVVKVSSLGAHPDSPLPGLAWHGRIERHLLGSGVPAVMLQANFLMSNLLAAAGAIQTGRLAPAGHGRVSMIDPRDVAAAAAAVLAADDSHTGTFVLTGGEALSYQEVATHLSAATGRTITYLDVPEDAATQALVDAGLPDWAVTHLTQAFRLIRHGDLSQVTDVWSG